MDGLRYKKLNKTKMTNNKIAETVYFQPPGINIKYCEAGMISETDPEYIWYYNEPCKMLISDVKIIPKENVVYNNKNKSYEIKLK